MNDFMKAALEEVEAAREVLSNKMEALQKVCDHQDESGSWERAYDPYTESNVCRYCGKDL